MCVWLCLTCDVEPPLAGGLRHDDAHHVSDGLRLHHGEGEVGLVERDWLGRRRRAGDPLHVQPGRGRARRAALVRGSNLEISAEMKALMRVFKG